VKIQRARGGHTFLAEKNRPVSWLCSAELLPQISQLWLNLYIEVMSTEPLNYKLLFRQMPLGAAIFDTGTTSPAIYEFAKYFTTMENSVESSWPNF
jgi:hypothetical protein